MGLRYNPFNGSFDFTRSPGSYLDGEVATFADLPLDTAAAPLNSAWLVREASGLWLVNRKPAGIYIRTATGGTDRNADYTYASAFPDVFSDANFTLYDDADSTKNAKFQLSGITTGTTRTLTVPDASGTLPLLETANTFTQNQTLNGTNNVAPNQTAASGSSLITRDLGDARFFNLRNPNVVLFGSMWSGGNVSTSGGAASTLGSYARASANSGAGNRGRINWYLYIGNSRGIDWSKKVRGTIVFNLDGDSRGTVRAFIGDTQSYTNGNPTRPCAGFKVTGSTLTAFVHDGTTYTEHGTAAVTLSGNNWAFVPRVFEFTSDGAGNISFTLDGATITGGAGARTTQSNLSEALNIVAESDAATTATTAIEAIRVVAEQL
jgi:hypothetical protein